jgi:hypothetical protein
MPTKAQTESPVRVTADLTARRELIAYRVSVLPAMRLVPAPHERVWMDATPNRFAYRCLPLVMANQFGWWVLNSSRIIATWNGTDAYDGIRIEADDKAPCPACSHFGSGILTFQLPWLFRTPPGYNLLVRGPTNLFKDAAVPLDGLVESDWSMSTFTMNWQLTRRNIPVIFEKGEPIAMLVPQRRYELESFYPVERELDTDPDVSRQFRLWRQTRTDFLQNLKIGGTEANRRGWQKDYIQGRQPDGWEVPEHQTKIDLQDFRQC